MLKERQKSILSAVVQEHVRTARPVASEDIWKRFDFDCAPATIRNEMLLLDQLGFLEQPHVSAGRIPTDKGYRFYVDNFTDDANLSKIEQDLLENAFSKLSHDAFIKQFGKTAAHITQSFVAIGSFEARPMYETGLSEILEEPEFEDLGRIRLFSKFIGAFDEHIKTLLEATSDDEDEEIIFIGAENPLRNAREYTIMISRWEHGSGSDGFIASVSPRRTDYKKNRAFLREIKELSHD